MVNVANHHTGSFVFVVKPGDDHVGHIELPSGVVTPIEDNVWAEMKKNDIVQHWISVEKLRVVKANGEVPINNAELVDLIIPPELSRPEEEGNMKGVSAKVIDKRVETTVKAAPVEAVEAELAPVAKRGRKRK